MARVWAIWSAVALSSAALSAAAVVAGGATAEAHPLLPAGCVPTPPTVTCSYAATGAEQVFTIPAGVTSLQVTAAGAPGGASTFSSAALPGSGERVTGTVNVAGYVHLYVEVGGAATTDSLECASAFDPCVGGFNGGGSAGDHGGGGGGASDVRTIAAASAGSLGSRLLVAGGGGGSGQDGNCASPLGGAGGDAGALTGGAGGAAVVCTVGSSTGGGGGAQGAGGAAGSNTTSSNGPIFGAVGAQGTGGSAPGLGSGAGGGGGGWFGGGSGADKLADVGPSVQAATGGGGGSSKGPAGGTAAVSALASGSVTISYTPRAPIADIGVTITGPHAVAAGSRFTVTVTLTNHSTVPAFGVKTVLEFPRYLTVVSVQRFGARGERKRHKIQWASPFLPGDAVRHFRVTFEAAKRIQVAATLHVTTVSTGSEDLHLGNNQATLTVRIG